MSSSDDSIIRPSDPAGDNVYNNTTHKSFIDKRRRHTSVPQPHSQVTMLFLVIVTLQPYYAVYFLFFRFVSFNIGTVSDKKVCNIFYIPGIAVVVYLY